MNELLICKSLLYAKKVGVSAAISGINELDQLDNGAIAVFTDRNELVTAANAATIFENRQQFYIAVGQQGNTFTTSLTNIGSKVSEYIDRNSVHYQKKDYSAPAKQKVTIGVGADASGNNGMGGTVVAGTYANMRIFETTIGTIPNTKIERYEYRVKVGDTVSDVLEGLITKINANTTLGVATAQGATGSVVGIYFTVNDYNQTVEITCDDIMLDATIDYTTTARGSVVINYGVGTAAQVAEMEEERSVEEGNTNKTHIPQKYWKYTPVTDPAGTYDIYSFTWSRRKSGPIKSVESTIQNLIVAMPDGATQQSTFEAIMLKAMLQEQSEFNGIES